MDTAYSGGWYGIAITVVLALVILVAASYRAKGINDTKAKRFSILGDDDADADGEAVAESGAEAEGGTAEAAQSVAKDNAESIVKDKVAELLQSEQGEDAMVSAMAEIDAQAKMEKLTLPKPSGTWMSRLDPAYKRIAAAEASEGAGKGKKHEESCQDVYSFDYKTFEIARDWAQVTGLIFSNVLPTDIPSFNMPMGVIFSITALDLSMAGPDIEGGWSYLILFVVIILILLLAFRGCIDGMYWADKKDKDKIELMKKMKE